MLSSSLREPKTAALIYIYHADIAKEIALLFNNLKLCNIDIFLAVNNELNITDIVNIFDSTKIKSIIRVPNMGVDILPFLQQILSLDIKKYPYFLKIHTKKSMWGHKNNVNWRTLLMHSLIGSESIFKRNVDILSTNDHIGMIATKGLILRNREFIHAQKIEELCSIFNIDYKKHKNKAFAAGSIFISKSKPFHDCFTTDKVKQIENLILTNNESGSVKDVFVSSGTYCHSLERIFGYLIRQNSMILKGLKLANYRILNKESQKGYFSLVQCYDNTCYLEEDLNCTGKIYSVSSELFIIEWRHLSNHSSFFQKYKKLDDKTLIKDL